MPAIEDETLNDECMPASGPCDGRDERGREERAPSSILLFRNWITACRQYVTTRTPYSPSSLDFSVFSCSAMRFSVRSSEAFRLVIVASRSARIARAEASCSTRCATSPSFSMSRASSDRASVDFSFDLVRAVRKSP